MIEPYYTREQAEALHKLRDAAGGKAFDVAWAKLIAEVRAEMECGEGPARDRAKALGQRWRTLVNQFTGGDGDVERLLYQAADKYYINCERSGLIAPNVVGYIRKVFEVVDA